MNNKAAIFYMLGASAVFSMMGILVKSLNGVITTFEVLFIRCFIGSVLIASYLTKNKIRIRGSHLKELYLRSIVGFLAASCFFYSVSKMKMADNSAIIRSSGLFVPFVAYFIAHEKFNKKDFLIALTGFLGVLFIIKPGTSVFNYSAIVALTGAFFQSVAFCSVRDLSSKEHPLRIVFYFLTVSWILSGLLGGGEFVLPTSPQWYILLGIATTGLIGQFLMTMAYGKASAGLITPVLYSELLFSTLFAAIIFSELPDLYSTIGIIIVVISTLVISKRTT
jgi:drug/metabolite transporter (DMT)-like permease